MELLHRRVENLLDHARETMHLVDEQHGAVLKIREDRCEIAGPFYRRSAGDLYRNSKLVGDHVRERGLPHSRRTVERDMLEWLVPRLRCLDHDAQLTFDLVLVDVLVVGEPLRP